MEGKKRINNLIDTAERKRKSKDHGSGITKEFLIVSLGDTLLGVHIEYLREVFDLPDRNDIIPLPFVPEYIYGVINVRGDIVPVLDLAVILGTGKTGEDSLKIVIIEGSFKVAFPVLEIVDMKTIDVKDLRTVKETKRKGDEQFITQEFTADGRTVSVVDILKLFGSQQLS